MCIFLQNTIDVYANFFPLLICWFRSLPHDNSLPIQAHIAYKYIRASLTQQQTQPHSHHIHLSVFTNAIILVYSKHFLLLLKYVQRIEFSLVLYLQRLFVCLFVCLFRWLCAFVVVFVYVPIVCDLQQKRKRSRRKTSIVEHDAQAANRLDGGGERQ